MKGSNAADGLVKSLGASCSVASCQSVIATEGEIQSMRRMLESAVAREDMLTHAFVAM